MAFFGFLKAQKLSGLLVISGKVKNPYPDSKIFLQ